MRLFLLVLRLLVFKCTHKLLLHVREQRFTGEGAIAENSSWYLSVIPDPTALDEDFVDFELANDLILLILHYELLETLHDLLLVQLVVSFHLLQALQRGRRPH